MCMLIGDANGCIWVYPYGLQQTGSPPPPTSNIFASVHGNRLWAVGVQGTNWTITWSHLQSHIWFADKVIYKTCKRATGRAEDCCSSQNPWAKVVQMRLEWAPESLRVIHTPSKLHHVCIFVDEKFSLLS